ncbi:MAG: hypothetical protein E7587_07615 [Ruminococcaceae bacterium]|nr:hypothetical protein [Oscillospiraceae bacterium]
MYTKETFLADLEECKLPDSFAQNFENLACEYYQNGVCFLSEDFIKSIDERGSILGELLPFVLESAEKVRKNELASLYSLCIYDMVKNAPEILRIKLAPKAESEDLEEKKLFDMAVYFALLAFAPELTDWCESACLPCDVASDTLTEAFKEPLITNFRRYGYYGFDMFLFVWMQKFLRHKVIRVGCLNFEIMKAFLPYCVIFKNKAGDNILLIKGKDISAGGMLTGCKRHEDKAFFADITETDEYYEGYTTDAETGKVSPTPVRLYKDEWEIAVGCEDHTIEVHIPSGVSFTQEDLAAAYKDVLKIIESSHPDVKPKAFMCTSWLLSTQLKDFLKPTSNIIGFQSKFNCKIPIYSDGVGVIYFLFLSSVEESDYTKLPENTSLQKKIKEYYLSGGIVYEWGGAFLI